ncbi:MAG TPA: lipocalin-like domain-containing protein [Terriglobales bacterium]
MKFLLAWLTLALLAFGQVKQTQTTQDRNLIVGAWSLSSYELRLKPSGKITTPFGPHPIGRILYEANGQMSAQLMRPKVMAFASDDPLRVTDEEAALSWRNYIGYWGTYTINARAGIITHHIEGAWFANWVGQNQTRAFRLSGDILSLDADSAAWHAHLTWKRIRENHLP